MKFARTFETALTNEDYPNHWVASAISYRQLKKCIKSIQKELSDIGLEPDMLAQLWRSFDPSVTATSHLRYVFAGSTADFKPKLELIMDRSAMLPIAASLAPQTRSFLQQLMLSRTSDTLEIMPESQDIWVDSSLLAPSTTNLYEYPCRGGTVNATRDVLSTKPQTVIVQIPLMNDSSFFRMLTSNVSGLGALLSKEEDGLSAAIGELGDEVSQLAEPSQHRGKTDLGPWRDIFALYTDFNIFFSTNEQDQFRRTAGMAQVQLQLFLEKMNELRLSRRLKKRDSLVALDRFISINLLLLKNLKFQELNTTAMTKILKKFDKRTALGARQTFIATIASDPFSSASLAKAVCFQISGKILAIIPQLSDYLCPVCFNAAWKPVRLQCNHIFCVRCILVMQRSNSGHCPLCRELVVMQADSTNIDPSLVNLLLKYFPTEVQAKQKENEHNAAIDSIVTKVAPGGRYGQKEGKTSRLAEKNFLVREYVTISYNKGHGWLVLIRLEVPDFYERAANASANSKPQILEVGVMKTRT